jgi:hypothetical protein
VNGRWRYYYDDSSSKKAAYEQATVDYNVAGFRLAAANVNRNESRFSRDTDGLVTKADLAEQKKLNADYNKTAIEYAAAGEKWLAAKKEYKKTRLSHITQAVISKAVVAVGNLFSNLFRKKR